MDKESHLKNFKFWGTATIGSKGQVVIPCKAREELRLNEGDQLLVVSPPNQAALGLIRAEELEAMLTQMQGHIETTLNNLKTNRQGGK